MDPSVRNSIQCRNLFERAVQDPCSHGCDYEDDDGLQQIAESASRSASVSASISGTALYSDCDDSDSMHTAPTFALGDDPLDPLAETYSGVESGPSESPLHPRSATASTHRRLQQLSVEDALGRPDPRRTGTPVPAPSTQTSARSDSGTGRTYSAGVSAGASAGVSAAAKTNAAANSAPPVWTNPFAHAGDDTPQDTQAAQGLGGPFAFVRQGSVATAATATTQVPQGLALNRTRTNSSCYIQQQTRRSLRSSLGEPAAGPRKPSQNAQGPLLLASNPNSNFNSISSGSASVGPPGAPARCKHSSISSTSSGNYPNLVRPKTFSHSSCSSILTHLYGLDKYISSDLDARSSFSTEDGFSILNSDHPYGNASSFSGGGNSPLLAGHTYNFSAAFPDLGGKPESGNTSTNPNEATPTPAPAPNNPALLLSNQNSRSDLSLHNYPGAPPGTQIPFPMDFVGHRKRQKSFIEQSLASSFSQPS